MSHTAVIVNSNRTDAYCQAVLITLVVLHVAAIFILASVPPVSRDALVHHLAVPKLYMKQGGMAELPGLDFSYYPMNLNLLYLVPLYFGNDIWPKYIHFSFALFTGLLIYRYLRPRLGSLYALAAALLFLTVPIIVRLSIIAYVDLGVVFFSFAALLLLLRWADSGFRPAYLVLAGVCCGLAMGTKYNGLLVCFILAVIATVLQVRRGPRVRFQQVRAALLGGVFVLISLAVFSPWMIRNAVWTGNPVYPLYKQLFQSSAPPPAIDARPKIDEPPAPKPPPWNYLTIRRVAFKESWWQIALLPIRIFFEGRDDDPRYFDGRLSPFLLVLPLFSFYGFRRDGPRLRAEKSALCAFVVLYLALSFALGYGIRIRYLVPIVAPLVVLSVFGLHNMVRFIRERGYPRLAPACAAAVMAAALGLHGSYLVSQFETVDPFSYLGGRLNREAYILQHRPEYAVIGYANRHLAGDSKILALFMGNRRYYSDRSLLFDETLLYKAVIRARSPVMVSDELKKRGVTHLIVRYDLFMYWAENSFSAVHHERLMTFFGEKTALLISEGGYGLYRL